MVRAIAAAALAIAFAPCYVYGGDDTYVPTYAPTAAPTYAPTAAPASLYPYNLVELAMKANVAGDFDTLIGAVVKADLVDTLSNTGPYTVFAPTDYAFEAINITTDSLDDYDADTLKEILLYHTLSGEYTVDEVEAMSSLTTLEGEDIEVDGRVLNGNANITLGNNYASNGIIHVIDGVLIPPSFP